jgi:xylulokinase
MSDKTAVITVDLGTTGCKSMVFDAAGTILAEHYAEYELICTPEGLIEQDAAIWRTLVGTSVRAAAQQAAGSGARIRALALSSQGISFVPVGADGQILGRAISWLDSRATAETAKLREMLPEKVWFQRTGKRLNPLYTLPKLLWLRQEQPERYRQAAWFLMPLDFITWQLTGHACTDLAMASGTMAFNIQNGTWDQMLLDACGLDAGKLPPVAVAGSLVGPILPEVARNLGLADDVQVFLGSQDQKCAAWGAGITDGLATVSLGTACAVSVLCDRPVLDAEMRVPCFALGNGRWMLEAVAGTAGASLKWLRRTLFPDLDYTGLTELAADSEPGARGVSFLPHLEGAGSPFWQPDQRGSLLGIGLATGRADLVRALLEGIACQIRTNLAVLETISGSPIRALTVFGGGSRSRLWCSLIADITGRPVHRLQTAEIANVGAARLALAGLAGESPAAGWPGGSLDLVAGRVRDTLEPDPARQLVYDRIYRRYRDLETRLLT